MKRLNAAGPQKADYEVILIVNICDDIFFHMNYVTERLRPSALTLTTISSFIPYVAPPV